MNKNSAFHRFKIGQLENMFLFSYPFSGIYMHRWSSPRFKNAMFRSRRPTLFFLKLLSGTFRLHTQQPLLIVFIALINNTDTLLPHECLPYWCRADEKTEKPKNFAQIVQKLIEWTIFINSPKTTNENINKGFYTKSQNPRRKKTKNDES